jgi:hypothetical protein
MYKSLILFLISFVVPSLKAADTSLKTEHIRLSPTFERSFSDCLEAVAHSGRDIISLPEQTNGSPALGGFHERRWLAGAANWGSSDFILRLIDRVLKEGKTNRSLEPIVSALKTSGNEIIDNRKHGAPLFVCFLPQGCTLVDSFGNDVSSISIGGYANLLPRFFFEQLPPHLSSNDFSHPRRGMGGLSTLFVNSPPEDTDDSEVLAGWIAKLIGDASFYVILRHLIGWAAENFDIPTERDQYFINYFRVENGLAIIEDPLFILLMAKHMEVRFHVEQLVLQFLTKCKDPLYENKRRALRNEIISWLRAKARERNALKNALKEDAYIKEFGLNENNIFTRIREVHEVIYRKATLAEDKMNHRN